MAFSFGMRWEMFYTTSLNDEELVDQICIDGKSKRYILDIDANDMITDGYDSDDNSIDSTYVSRTIFDIIVEGIKKQNFVEYISNNSND